MQTYERSNGNAYTKNGYAVLMRLLLTCRLKLNR